MGENFTQIPNELFESGLTALEKLVWIVIKKHDWNGGGSWPSASLIAQESGLHRNTVLRIVASCETKGLVSVIRKRGEVNRYKLSTTSTTEQLVAENNQLQRSATPAPEKCYPAPEKCYPAPEKCPNKTQEEDIRKRHKKYTRSTSDQIESSRRKAEESLDALDLTKYEEKYPKLNVSSEFQKCKDYHLSKQANFHGPKRYTDWGRVLHTWFRNATERIDARASPKPKRFMPEDFYAKGD